MSQTGRFPAVKLESQILLSLPEAKAPARPKPRGTGHVVAEEVDLSPREDVAQALRVWSEGHSTYQRLILRRRMIVAGVSALMASSLAYVVVGCINQTL